MLQPIIISNQGDRKENDVALSRHYTVYDLRKKFCHQT